MKLKVNIIVSSSVNNNGLSAISLAAIARAPHWRDIRDYKLLKIMFELLNIFFVIHI